MSDDQPRLIMITGIMAAGKSTVAQGLAERLPRSVHLRGDLFRRMIVGGRAEMGFDLDPEASRQLWLRYRVAAAAARLYLEAGFTVVYQDIVIGPALATVLDYYHDHPVFCVVLCPEPGNVARRDQERAKTAYHDTVTIEAFDQVLRAETPRLGLWLDNGPLTAGETVDRILTCLAAARIQ
jgi:predicted kinase